MNLSGYGENDINSESPPSRFDFNSANAVEIFPQISAFWVTICSLRHFYGVYQFKYHMFPVRMNLESELRLDFLRFSVLQ